MNLDLQRYRPILLFGLAGGLLAASLRFIEYRFLIVEHSVAIYGGLIALLFAAVGIRLGLTLTFGLISGAVSSAMMLLTLPFHDRIGFDNLEILGYTTIVMSFLLVFFGVRSYRDNVAGGQLTFTRALRVGLLITVVSCACYVATWQLVCYRLAPGFADEYAAHYLEEQRASGATEEQLQATARQMEEFRELYQNPLFNVAITFLEPFPIGLAMSLITAGLLRRRPESHPAGAATTTR